MPLRQLPYMPKTQRASENSRIIEARNAPSHTASLATNRSGGGRSGNNKLILIKIATRPRWYIALGDHWLNVRSVSQHPGASQAIPPPPQAGTGLLFLELVRPSVGGIWPMVLREPVSAVRFARGRTAVAQLGYRVEPIHDRDYRRSSVPQPRQPPPRANLG